MNNFAVSNLSKSFDTDDGPLRALERVSIVVQPGEFLCLMGPSGCGKSTLLRIMAGLDTPTSGAVMNRPERIGFVFQNFGLMPWLTVAENIGFGLKMAGRSQAEIKRVVAAKVKQLGLRGLEQAHPKELSGGQKQRVGIARALAIDPEVLMLDEPFSALDTFTAEELRHDLLSIWQKTDTTFIMVTHLPSEAVELADRIVVFSARPGRVIEDTKVDLSRPRNLRSAPFYKLVDRLEDLIRPKSKTKSL
jgi:ABC-type nitrate/sulfonate/bicarbonate transport system ATPase subunit